MKLFYSHEWIINWLHSKLSSKQFLILSSVLVGLTAGLTAVLLKTLVHYIHLAIIYNYHFRFQYYLYLIFPLIGILLTVYMVKQFFNLQEPFDFHNVPFYMILGVMTGMVSVYYTRMFVRVGKLFGQNKQKVYQKAIMGGLFLALLIFLFPPLFGEGYESIKVLSGNNARELLNKSILSKYAASDWFVLVMKKFDTTGLWNLPVVEDGQYVGFVSKSSLLTKYRSRLIRTTSE